MVTAKEHEKRLGLYRKGLNDREIGDQCFVSNDAIYSWRKKYGLKANRPVGQPRKERDL